MDNTIVIVDERGSRVIEESMYRAEYDNITRITESKHDNHTSHGSVHTFMWIYISPLV